MSRTEELRKKLRNKAFDKGFSDFNLIIEQFLNQQRTASAGNSNFARKIYDEYRNSGSTEATSWIKKRLEGVFICETTPPIWPDEPDWCFHNDEPMIFVGQFADKLGTSFFLFKTEYKDGDGFRELFKMLAQDKDGKIHLDGEIRG